MADPQVRKSPKLDHVRPMANSQEQQTGRAPLLDDEEVWFREKLTAALRPVDPQPKPAIQDRLYGSAYKEAYDALFLELNRHKCSEILDMLHKSIQNSLYGSDYLLLIHCQANLLRAVFELEGTALRSLRKITEGPEVGSFRVRMLPGYILECDWYGLEHRYNGYRFTPGKQQEVRNLASQFDERIRREKPVKTVQERVERAWTDKVCVSTLLNHVDHISASPTIKEGLRIVLREHLGSDVLFPPERTHETMKWAVRLTDEWLRKTAKGGGGWLYLMAIGGGLLFLLFLFIETPVPIKSVQKTVQEVEMNHTMLLYQTFKNLSLLIMAQRNYPHPRFLPSPYIPEQQQRQLRGQQQQRQRQQQRQQQEQQLQFQQHQSQQLQFQQRQRQQLQFEQHQQQQQQQQLHFQQQQPTPPFDPSTVVFEPSIRFDPTTHQVPTPSFLRPEDKRAIDMHYMAFPLVFARLWPELLRKPLVDFCRAAGPLLQPKEPLFGEVWRLLGEWTMLPTDKLRACTLNGYKSPRERYEKLETQAKLEYNRRVRCCHVKAYRSMYQEAAVAELRKMGAVVGL
ncbi:MAG: hypothetical protein LQ345_004566 [Seirophora villosa]|nr:MAG: hypothetical protein LQ345_004566 [Seirophora villosa]